MRIAITRTGDLPVAIMHGPDDMTAEFIADQIEAWKSTAPGEYVSHRVFTGTLPADKTFRGAWTDALPGENIDVDLPKARGVHMARIRAARNAKLAETDIEAVIEMENGDVSVALKAKRTKLRDLPATFDLDQHTTTEELAAAWPAELD